jgi:hypothetical protein
MNPRETATVAEQFKAALARTAKDWFEIYIEMVEVNLRHLEKTDPKNHAATYATWTQESRPRLRRICAAFTAAGLNLSDQLEVEGPDIRFGKIVFPDPTRPRLVLHWPDGQYLTFDGVDAMSATAFFIWWQNFQVPLFGTDSLSGSQDNKILKPGDAAFGEYMRAKAADQRKGQEPG